MNELSELPDDAVLSKAEAARFIGVSKRALERLHAQGGGPRRVRMTPRRVGYQVGALREWLKKLPED